MLLLKIIFLKVNTKSTNAVRAFFFIIIQINTCVAFCIVLAKLPENTRVRSSSGNLKWVWSFQVRIIPYATAEISI